MLLKVKIVEAIVAGRVDRAYRRWAAPRAVAGGRQRTHLGELRVESVEEVDPSVLTEADARAAGHASLALLRRELDRREGPVWCVRLACAGEDPRVALREEADLDAAGLAELRERLARKDRGGPWTLATLRLIGEQEGRRAADLAEALGEDKARLKRRVRSLKELGLTESLETGYRLSPRGRALLDTLG